MAIWHGKFLLPQYSCKHNYRTSACIDYFGDLSKPIIRIPSEQHDLLAVECVSLFRRTVYEQGFYLPLWPNGISHLEQTGSADRKLPNADKPPSKVQPDGSLKIHGMAYPFLVVGVADSQGYEDAMAKAERILMSKVRGLRVRIVIVVNLVQKTRKQRRRESAAQDGGSAADDKVGEETGSELSGADPPIKVEGPQINDSGPEKHAFGTNNPPLRLQSKKRLANCLPDIGAKRPRATPFASS